MNQPGEAFDCGDNSCIFALPTAGGMRTNGGCHCLDYLRPRLHSQDIHMLRRMIRLTIKAHVDAVKT